MLPCLRPLALCLLSMAAWAGTGQARDGAYHPFDGWYAGLDLSSVSLRIPGRSVDMEGIQFTEVNARTDQAGLKFYMGYWIDPHLGLEGGIATFGHADATFAYRVPPAESGTGATTVDVSNASLALLLAQRFDRWTLFLRGGVQAWQLTYKSRFRLDTGENQYRELVQKGNAPLWGAGLEYALKGAWHLRLEGEAMKMDIADARVLSLGVTYRF